MNMLPGFLIYLGDLKIFDRSILTDEDLGKCVRAIAEHIAKGVEPEGLPPTATAFYRVVTEKVDREQKVYQSKVDNGRKGGRPKENRTKPNETENDLGFNQETEKNKKENVNVTLNENENVNENLLFLGGQGPTLEDVRRYAQETKTTVSPEKFFNYYSSRRWMLKPDVPLSDWKAAFRVWIENESQRKQTPHEIKHVTAHYSGQREYTEEEMNSFISPLLADALEEVKKEGAS